MKRLIIVWLLLLLPGYPEQLRLTPAEAVERALSFNSSLEVARYEPALRATQVTVERGAFDPVISGGTSLGAHRLGSSSDWGARLEHRLAQGATYSLEHNRGTGFQGQSGSETLLRMRVPLLRGAGAHINRAPVNIAKGRVEQAETRLQVQALDLAADVESTYWALVMAQRVLAVRQRAVRQATELKQLLQTEIEIGTAAPFEMFEAEQNLESRKAEVESARGDLALAEQALSRLIGEHPGATKFATVDPEAFQLARSVEEYQRSAVENRPLLKTVRQQQRLLKLEERLARNETRPQLDVVASYGLGDQQLTRHRWQAGLQLTIPLGNHAAEGRLDRVRLSRKQADAELEDLRQRVLLETAQAYSLVEASLRQSQAAARASAHAAQRVAAEKTRFTSGFSPAHRLIFAQQQQLVTDEDQVSALIRQELALVSLARATGTSLSRFGLKLDEDRSASPSPQR